LPVIRDFDQPHGCFADEIAIDFPSVGNLVERVRNRFLGHGSDGADAPATHTAEVSLSRRDATTGTVVSLEVPLRGTCRLCGGRGETWAEPCAACCGTGEALVQRPVRLTVPAGVADGARLRFRVHAPHAAPLRVVVRVAIRTPAA
jgi:DnaJ-class molecular chaperone